MTHKWDERILVVLMIIFLTITGLIGLNYSSQQSSTIVPTAKTQTQSEVSLSQSEAYLNDFDAIDADSSDIDSINQDLDPANF